MAELSAMRSAAEDTTMTTAAEQSMMQTTSEDSQLMTARGHQSLTVMTQAYPVNTLAMDVEYVAATSARGGHLPAPAPVSATPPSPYSAGARSLVARSPSMLDPVVDYLTTARPMESQPMTHPSQMMLTPVHSTNSVHPSIGDEGVEGMRTAQLYGNLPASVSEMSTVVTPAETYGLGTVASAGKLAPSTPSTVYTGSVRVPSMMELRTANSPSINADGNAVEANLRTAASPVPTQSAVVKATLVNLGDYLLRLDGRDNRPMVSVRTGEMIVRHVRLPAWDGLRGGYPVIDNRRVVMTDAREWCNYHKRNTEAIKTGCVLRREVTVPISRAVVKATLVNMGDYMIRLDTRDGRPMVSMRTEVMSVRHIRLPPWDCSRGGYPVVESRRIVKTDARVWCNYHNKKFIKTGCILRREVTATAPSL